MLSMFEKLGRVVNRSVPILQKFVNPKNLQTVSERPLVITESSARAYSLLTPICKNIPLATVPCSNSVIQPRRSYTTGSNLHSQQPPNDLQSHQREVYDELCHSFPNESDVFYKLLKLGIRYNKNGPLPFRNILLVGMQHMLGTTVDMIKVMKALGLQEAVVGGKSFSNHEGSIKRFQDLDANFTFVESNPQIGYGAFSESFGATVQGIWLEVMKKVKNRATPYDMIIVLDEGGDLLSSTAAELFRESSDPNRNLIVGVEQSSNGINRPGVEGLPYPIINFAKSYQKGAEHLYVAEVAINAALLQIKEKVANATGLIVGIVGLGTMGKAIHQTLLQQGFRVIVYDRNQALTAACSSQTMDSCAALFTEADIIIGCTGKDITASADVMTAVKKAQRTKWLVSTRSNDTEFNSLLRSVQIAKKKAHTIPNSLRDISYENSAGTVINILKGGFPINFNNQEHSVPPEDIWMTRAGLLLSCLGYTNLLRKNQPDILRECDQILQFDPKAQLIIIMERLKTHRTDELFFRLESMSQQEAEAYIAERSVGKAMPPISENHEVMLNENKRAIRPLRKTAGTLPLNSFVDSSYFNHQRPINNSKLRRMSSMCASASNTTTELNDLTKK